MMPLLPPLFFLHQQLLDAVGVRSGCELQSEVHRSSQEADAGLPARTDVAVSRSSAARYTTGACVPGKHEAVMR